METACRDRSEPGPKSDARGDIGVQLPAVVNERVLYHAPEVRAPEQLGSAARGAAGDIPVFIPSLTLSTDNAAMIAAAGLRRYQAGLTAALDLNAEAGLTL